MEYSMKKGKGPVIVVAVGGNALLREHQKGLYEEQIDNVEKCTAGLARLIVNGYQLVLIHGNGPQVGLLMQRAEASATTIPPVPLFVHSAETQGQIGLQLMNSLNNRLATSETPVATILTWVVVDPADPAFRTPTKPVGTFHSLEEIEAMARKKPFSYIEDSGRGYRKVVASPRPLEIIETDLVRDILHTGRSVIAAGGGGVPVVRRDDGKLEEVEAVIDKDLSAALLATSIKADMLVILTGVEHVAINFNKPDMRLLDTVSVSTIKTYQQQGHFPPGSMGPKIAACINFVEKTGGKAIITTLDKAVEAIAGKAGTIIVPDSMQESRFTPVPQTRIPVSEQCL